MKQVLLDCYLSIDGNDLSAYTKKVEVSAEAEVKDVTTYGSGGWNERLSGLKSGSLDCDFLQDFAASALDSILWPLLGTNVPFEVRPSQAAVSASNPKWTGTCVIGELKPIQGSVGDEATMGVSFPCSGPVVRAEA